MNVKPDNKLPRERQTVWCCGHPISRWRYKGRRKFHGLYRTHCPNCGGFFIWPPYRQRSKTEIERASYKRRTDETRWRGAARPRQLLTRAQRLSRMRVRWHARAAGFVAAGLTSRGAPRIYRPRISERERAWRAFRASLTIIRPDYLLTVGRGKEAA